MNEHLRKIQSDNEKLEVECREKRNQLRSVAVEVLWNVMLLKHSLELDKEIAEAEDE